MAKNQIKTVMDLVKNEVGHARIVVGDAWITFDSGNRRWEAWYRRKGQHQTRRIAAADEDEQQDIVDAVLDAVVGGNGDDDEAEDAVPYVCLPSEVEANV